MRSAHRPQGTRPAALVSGGTGLVRLAAAAWILRELSTTSIGLIVALVLAVWGFGALAFGLAAVLGLIRRDD